MKRTTWTLPLTAIGLIATTAACSTFAQTPRSVSKPLDANRSWPTLFTAAPAATTAPLFVGDFETGDLSQWADNQSCPHGVTIVTSPVRAGRFAAKFTVADGDTHAKCSRVPTDDPRAQLVSRGLFTEGDDDYIGFSSFFPAYFPTTTDWFQIAEVYGPPFGGSPPIGFDVVGNRLVLARDQTHHYDQPWTAGSDIPKGKAWEDIIAHVKFSTDPKVGFIEIWRDGVKQTFTNGKQRLYYDTLVYGVNWDGTHSPNWVAMNQYRSRATPLGTVTLYHDEVRVGKTFASVVPPGARGY